MASECQMKDPLLVGKSTVAHVKKELPRDYPLERDFKENTSYTITDHVNQLHAQSCNDPRTLFIYTSLVEHLHAFIRDTRLTRDELEKAVNFLTRAGRESSDFMNEFALLGLVLGINTLIDEISHPKPQGCTASCEAGPFFTDDFPVYPSGSTIAQPGTRGEPMFFSATVRSITGDAIQGVKAEVWQVDGDGLYDLEGTDINNLNDRGRIIAEDDGTFCYRSVLPTAYSLPTEGPSSEMLRTLGRHPHRSSHIHFRLTAPKYYTLVTALYPSHSPFLGSDPVFATRKSLVVEVKQETDRVCWARMGFEDNEVLCGRVWVLSYDFVLPTLKEVEELRSGISTS